MDTVQRIDADELREGAHAFVDDHVGVYLVAQDDGELLFAGNDAAQLFGAADDWLREHPAVTVEDVKWQRRGAEPAFTLKLILIHGVGVERHVVS